MRIFVRLLSINSGTKMPSIFTWSSGDLGEVVEEGLSVSRALDSVTLRQNTVESHLSRRWGLPLLHPGAMVRWDLGRGGGLRRFDGSCARHYGSSGFGGAVVCFLNSQYSLSLAAGLATWKPTNPFNEVALEVKSG